MFHKPATATTRASESAAAASSQQPPPQSIMELVRMASGVSFIDSNPRLLIKIGIVLNGEINAAITFSCGVKSDDPLRKPFDTEFTAFLRTLDYVQYNAGDGSKKNSPSFSIPLALYLQDPERLSRDTSERYNRGVAFRGFPREFMQCFYAPKSPAQREADACAMAMQLDERLPASLLETLKPYQYEGVAFAIRNNGRCLIGDDMGLGKSLQAITIWRFYAEDMLAAGEMTLIVCPSSLRVQWAREFVKWLPDYLEEKRDFLVILKGSDFSPAAAAGKRVLVLSYDLASRLKQQLHLLKPGMVIFDESHMIKNFMAQRTQTLLPFAQQSRRAILLSGTPAFARPMELYTQIRALRPDMFTDRHEFGVRYCGAFKLPGRQSRTGRDVWVYNGCTNGAELHLLVKNTIMIRRLKKNVLTQLPEKTREQVFLQVAMSKAVEKKMVQARRLVKEMDSRQSAGPGKAAQGMAVALAKPMSAEDREKTLFEMYAEMAQCKQAAVKEYLRDFFETNPEEKVLLFAHHRVLLDALEETVRSECKVGHIRIDGSTAPAKRQEMVERFQGDSACRVAVLGITAAGVGLTLTAASVVIFAELHWTPAALLQCEDRAYRIGQKNNVLIKYLVGRDTMEEDMWDMIAKKFDTVSRLLDNDEKKEGLGATVVANGTVSGLLIEQPKKKHKSD